MINFEDAIWDFEPFDYDHHCTIYIHLLGFAVVGVHFVHNFCYGVGFVILVMYFIDIILGFLHFLHLTL